MTAFNGARYRQRPIPDVIREFRLITEKRVFVVDDNLIGTAPAQISRAKELFRALAEANLGKQWIAQTTINFADDEELLELAARAGCVGVFIGFESPTPEGLAEIGKKFNLAQGQRLPRLRAPHSATPHDGGRVLHDRPGCGRQGHRPADRAAPPATTAWTTSTSPSSPPCRGPGCGTQMKAEERIPLGRFPEDWKYYTLMYPVARYQSFSLEGAIEEMTACNRSFYSAPRIARRMAGSIYSHRSPLFSLVHNLSSRRNSRLLTKAYCGLQPRSGRKIP